MEPLATPPVATSRNTDVKAIRPEATFLGLESTLTTPVSGHISNFRRQNRGLMSKQAAHEKTRPPTAKQLAQLPHLADFIEIRKSLQNEREKLRQKLSRIDLLGCRLSPEKVAKAKFKQLTQLRNDIESYDNFIAHLVKRHQSVVTGKYYKTKYRLRYPTIGGTRTLITREMYSTYIQKWKTEVSKTLRTNHPLTFEKFRQQNNMEKILHKQLNAESFRAKLGIGTSTVGTENHISVTIANLNTHWEEVLQKGKTENWLETNYKQALTAILPDQVEQLMSLTTDMDLYTTLAHINNNFIARRAAYHMASPESFQTYINESFNAALARYQIIAKVTDRLRSKFQHKLNHIRIVEKLLPIRTQRILVIIRNRYIAAYRTEPRDLTLLVAKEIEQKGKKLKLVENAKSEEALLFSSSFNVASDIIICMSFETTIRPFEASFANFVSVALILLIYDINP